MSNPMAREQCFITTQTPEKLMHGLLSVLKNGECDLPEDVQRQLWLYMSANVLPASSRANALKFTPATLDDRDKKASGKRLLRQVDPVLRRKGIISTVSSGRHRRDIRRGIPHRNGVSYPYGEDPIPLNQSFYRPENSDDDSEDITDDESEEEVPAGAPVERQQPVYVIHEMPKADHKVRYCPWSVPESGNVGREGPPRDFNQSFSMPHTDPQFERLYPHANREEYEHRPTGWMAAEDAVRRTRWAARHSTLPRERPGSLPTSGDLNSPPLHSFPPVLFPRVEKWGTGRHVEDVNQEAEVEINAETIPKPEVSTEVPVAEPEHREHVPVVDKGESAIIVEETVMSFAEPETNGQSTDETEANGNIQHDFISELEPPVPITGVNGEMETPEDSQDISQGESIFTASQVNDTQLTHDSTYGSQEEVCDLIERMDDIPRYRAPRQLRGTSRPIADEDAPGYGLRSARQQRQSSPLVADNAVLGKRSRAFDARNEDVPQRKVTKLSTSDAEQTANELASKVACAGLRATRERITAAAEAARAAENADDEEL